MPDFTKRVRKRLVLPEDEIVEQAAVAQPTGSISRGFAESWTPFGAVSGAVRAKLAYDGPDGTLAGRISPRNGYLVVTNKRFLWAAQSRTGSVGEVEAAFGFDEVASVDLADGGGMGNQILGIGFADTSGVELAVAKGQHPGRLASAMQSKLDRR